MNWLVFVKYFFLSAGRLSITPGLADSIGFHRSTTNERQLSIVGITHKHVAGSRIMNADTPAINVVVLNDCDPQQRTSQPIRLSAKSSSGSRQYSQAAML